MGYSSGKIVVRDGKTYFAVTRDKHLEPVRYTLFFRIDCYPGALADGTEGRLRTGEWVDNCVVECGEYPHVVKARLLGWDKVALAGGAPDAEIVEEQPIPPPKVRRGTEVKYDGFASIPGWQKRTAKGWVKA